MRQKPAAAQPRLRTAYASALVAQCTFVVVSEPALVKELLKHRLGVDDLHDFPYPELTKKELARVKLDSPPLTMRVEEAYAAARSGLLDEVVVKGHPSKRPLSAEEFVREAEAVHDQLHMVRLFFHFWSKGFVLSTGTKFGGQYLLYQSDRSKEHVRRLFLAFAARSGVVCRLSCAARFHWMANTHRWVLAQIPAQPSSQPDPTLAVYRRLESSLRSRGRCSSRQQSALPWGGWATPPRSSSSMLRTTPRLAQWMRCVFVNDQPRTTHARTQTRCAANDCAGEWRCMDRERVRCFQCTHAGPHTNRHCILKTVCATALQWLVCYARCKFRAQLPFCETAPTMVLIVPGT